MGAEINAREKLSASKPNHLVKEEKVNIKSLKLL